MTKFRILGDVAPYSQQYASMRTHMDAVTKEDTERRIEFERIVDQVQQLKDSSLRVNERRFTAEVTRVDGTVVQASPEGLELEEYPGRRFKFSSLGMSAADMSAVILREHNNFSRSQVAQETDTRQARLREFVGNYLGSGTRVQLTVPQGAVEHSTEVSAVVEAGGVNINRALVSQGLADLREEEGGPEYQAMHGPMGVIGGLAESLSFTGDSDALRLLPTPFHTKLWQQKTALARYEEEELYGTRMRRWDRPIHDFLAPYARGTFHRGTGHIVVPEEVQRRRDLNTLSDMLRYLRAAQKGKYGEMQTTALGANLFGSSQFVSSTLPRTEQLYFKKFLGETDTDEREKILAAASPELARSLEAQWVSQDAQIARAEEQDVPLLDKGGRLITQAGMEEYRRAGSQLNYGDFQRSQEITEFFARTGFDLPSPESPLWDENIDYEDVKVKMVQQEGYNLHDFHLYDDRSALLWRKPWLDGAVRELTSGNQRSVEKIRQATEQILLQAEGGDPRVVAVGRTTRAPHSNIRIDFTEDGEEKLLRDVRRHPEEYQEV
jgi:hypothetical protein